jgi:hypothetical protein
MYPIEVGRDDREDKLLEPHKQPRINFRERIWQGLYGRQSLQRIIQGTS